MPLIHQPYRTACQWIADNDEPEDLDEHNIVGYISTMLVADLWQKNVGQVALDILRLRNNRVAREGITPFGSA